MLNFRPAVSRVRSKIRSPGPLLALASEVRELEPGITFECEPPIALPGELERVHEFFGSAANQVPRLIARDRTEGPTLSYRFDDALLADFTVYCGDRYEVYRGGGKRAVLTGTPEWIEEAQLCTTSTAQTYFGHLLRDSLPLEILAGRRGMPAITFTHEPWQHEPGYRDLLNMHPLALGHARVANLWITDERALNGGWQSRVEELRAKLRSAVRPGPGDPVFLRRGSRGTSRALLNEDALCEGLDKLGFRIIAPESLAARDLAEALGGAQITVCVEGSAQDHALIAMPRGATLLTIQPPYRFNSFPKSYADAAGMRFAYTVADPAHGGFHLDLERLRRTLDLIP